MMMLRFGLMMTALNNKFKASFFLLDRFLYNLMCSAQAYLLERAKPGPLFQALYDGGHQMYFDLLNSPAARIAQAMEFFATREAKF